jgi:ABC-type lipoprotein release transport system permease subunit
MIFIKLGMKNLWRNKRRSLLAGLAIGIGLASLIVADGFWIGMMNNMVKTVTNSYIGHVQIHTKDFKLTKEVKFSFNADSIVKKIRLNKDIAAYSTRVLSEGMINSAQDAKNIQIVGIDPDREKEISLFSRRILKGKYLNSTQELLLGVILAQKLQVSIGDRVVVTTSDLKGELSQNLFRVSGIYGLGNRAMDEYMVVIHQRSAQEILTMDSGVHELVIKFKNLALLDKNLSWLDQLESQSITINSWKDLAPQVVAAVNMYDISIGIIASLLLSLVALGILNTMFMSLYERMFEFGVLRAIGTRGSEILLMILSEAMALALLAIIIGSIIALILGGYMATYGIDYAGIEFAEMTFTEKIFFEFRWQQFVFFPLIIFIFTILVSLYPGVHAVRITMAKALQKSL